MQQSKFGLPVTATGSTHPPTSSQDIREAIRSFAGICGDGVDGLRAIHLQDPISDQIAEAGNLIMLSLTSLVVVVVSTPSRA